MPVERKEGICIGKNCRYNKENCGEYCSLKNAVSTRKGDPCVLGERIAQLESEIRGLQETVDQMKRCQQSIREANRQ